MKTKIEELEKELKELENKVDECILDKNNTNTFYIRLLEIKRAELKGLKEGIEIGKSEFAKVSCNYSVGRQETLAKVKKMILDEHNSREDILKKLKDMK